ncbi:MAG: GDP-mannose 4,6-dehydratase [bacterium]|nr:GDP-mannose 4,6-dehydratase [bacterium]
MAIRTGSSSPKRIRPSFAPPTPSASTSPRITSEPTPGFSACPQFPSAFRTSSAPASAETSRRAAISIFAEKIFQQAPLTLYGEGRAARDYLFVTDAAAAFRLAADKIHDGGAYNLGTGVATEIHDVLAQLASALGPEPAEVRLAPLREGEIFRISLDAGQFREGTGWKPIVSLAAGIEIFAEWFAEKGGPH